MLKSVLILTIKLCEDLKSDIKNSAIKLLIVLKELLGKS
jgi:hypothetical protein